jgi:alkylation response protein AidB-like acyl-CoA dehydrogenase
VTIAALKHHLPDSVLERCGERASIYDRENRFFADDFEELKSAGFLKLNIPQEFGGQGFSLAETGKELRSLAYRAGGFHPANGALVHEIVGKTTLGVGLEEVPRWG